MKIEQIYSFEQHDPPALTEAVLRDKSEQRAIKRATVTLALCGVAFFLCLIAKGIILYPVNAVLATAIITYASVSFCGAGAIALTYARTHRMRQITLKEGST